MASKPAIYPTWATDGGALIQNPGSAKQGEGFKVEIPPVEYFNWLLNLHGAWTQYLDQELAKVQEIQGLFDAIVGNGGSHADINAVIADMDGETLPTQDVRIFVKDPLTVLATQVVNKEGVEISFAPKAFVAGGAGLVKGLQVDASRVKILHGRFMNFDEVGGVALELTANAKNCHVLHNSFINNEEDLVNNGANNQLIGNMTEVV